ncbi:hypothetical protein ACHAXA_000573 [Cyclostephanos tholiformis]|uniref:PsbP C-terminal domain-containing protein n=1 Tax=Cyclostephanos tholiformis TaxID=382380 RepID=A0ABD3STF9_9STRA
MASSTTTAFLVLLSFLPGTASFLTPPSSSVVIAKVDPPPSPALLGHPHYYYFDGEDCIAASEDARLVDQFEASTRRSFLANAGAVGAVSSLVVVATTSRPPASYAAAAEKTSVSSYADYEDENYGFRLSVPSSWERSEQTLSGRRKATFFTDPSSTTPGGGIETLCIVAYTPVRDDFTSLSSFGSVDEVGQATILPKELAGGDGSTSNMISATSGRGAYYFDYYVASPTVPRDGPDSSGMTTRALKPQHFRTVFTLLPPVGNGAAGMTLVTITLQTSEDRYVNDLKGTFDGIIDSYEKIM